MARGSVAQAVPSDPALRPQEDGRDWDSERP